MVQVLKVRYGTYGILCEGRTVAELLFVKRCKLTHSQSVGINQFNTGVSVFGKELPFLVARPSDGNLISWRWLAENPVLLLLNPFSWGVVEGGGAWQWENETLVYFNF